MAWMSTHSGEDIVAAKYYLDQSATKDQHWLLLGPFHPRVAG